MLLFFNYFKKNLVLLFLVLSFPIFSQPVYLNSSQIVGLEVNVISSTSNSTTIEYVFNGFESKDVIVNGNEYSFLSAPDMIWMMEKGFPQIPITKNSIIVSDNGMVDFRVLSEDIATIKSKTILPSKGHFTRDIDPNSIPYTFNRFYQQNAWYPNSKISISEPYIVKDLRGVTIQYNPIQYNPQVSELKITKRMVVEFYYNNKLKVENPFNRTQPFRGVSSEFDNVYSTLFVNYKIGVHEYNPIPEPGRLLIIYNQAYASTIQPFYEYKLERGIPTIMAEYPTATGTGAASVKTFIQNKFNEPAGLTYIILVGEASEIPYLTGNYENAPSDPCYVKLVGSDAYPDAYISRISPTSTTNLAYIIKKIIKYEKYPDSGAGADWYHKGVGVASDESGSTPLTDYQRMNLIRDTLLVHGFVSIDQIYDPGASSSTVTTSINAGRSLVNYIGHGSGTSWSTTGFNVSAIKNLSNGYKNPFIIDVACQNGNFTASECMEEAWIRAGDTLNPKGAIAVYGSTTNTSWVPPCDMQTHSISLLANKIRNTVGGISFNGVMKAMDLWGGSSGEGLKLMEQYHIFGDCSMTMNFGLIPDTVAPAPITDLTITNPTSNSLTLQWTAPADSSYGGVVSYDIRHNTVPITNANFSSSPQAILSGNDSAGTPKSYSLSDLAVNTSYYIALKAKDMWGNTSLISNIPSLSTLAAPVMQVSCDSIYHTMMPNTVKTDSIIISNIAQLNSTLDYSVELTNNTFPQKNIKLKFVPLTEPSVTNSTDRKDEVNSEYGVSMRGSGGPDVFGYEWIDSDEPSGPQYVWNDIVASGTLVSNWTATGTFSATDEGYAGPIDLGFNYKFYGQNKNQIYISTNGYIAFDPISTNTYTNSQLPSNTTPNELICPFWDDLDAKAPGTVHYLKTSDKIVIQWTNYQKYSGTASYTFQLVLFKSGRILAYYNSMTGTINSASVGIENAAGNVGLQVAYNATYIKNNLALKIAADPEWVTSLNNSGTIYSGNHAKVVLDINTSDLLYGNYSMDMVITSNDPQHQTVTVPIKMKVSDEVPVEFTSFSANVVENSVSLVWATATETNNKGFSIERNSDGKWESVSFIEGNGTSTQPHEYLFNDKKLSNGKYTYRIKQIDFDGSFDYSNTIEVEVSNPEVYSLSQNYPNPFNPSTVIKFSLPEVSKVNLRIYNSLGELAVEMIDSEFSSGYHEVSFNASNLSSGIYLYVLTAESKDGSNNFKDVKKMMLLK